MMAKIRKIIVFLVVFLVVFLSVSLSIFLSTVFLSAIFSRCNGLFKCDLIFGSVLEDKIVDIEMNALKKVSELVEREWQIICILFPYNNFITGVEKNRAELINKKIEQLVRSGSMIYDDGVYQIIFSKDEDFDYFSFSRRKLDIAQGGFDKVLLDKFDQINFSPKDCTHFEQAAIFKFEKNNHTYITLGEIND